MKTNFTRLGAILLLPALMLINSCKKETDTTISTTTDSSDNIKTLGTSSFTDYSFAVSAPAGSTGIKQITDLLYIPPKGTPINYNWKLRRYTGRATGYTVYGVQPAYKGCLLNLKLPKEITEIGPGCFADERQLSFFEGPSVTTIGADAFVNCDKLYEVSFPNATSIKERAFKMYDTYHQSMLRKVYAPKLTKISEYAFYECRELSEISSLNKVVSIGAYAFYRVKNLKSIDLSMVESIGSSAFASSSVESITGLYRINRIGEQAFANCRYLTNVASLSNVQNIDANAFGGCIALTSVGNLNNVRRIECGAFADCPITSIRISYPYAKVAFNAFDHWVSTQTVYVSNFTYYYNSDLSLIDANRTTFPKYVNSYAKIVVY